MSRQELFIEELMKHDGALALFNWLNICCDVSFVGGSVRTILTDYKSPIKDFDCCVVVNDRELFNSVINSCNVTHNRFGGYKIKLDSVDFDIWELKDSLAEEKTFESLSYAAHLNFDGIVYDFTNDVLYAEPFIECVDSGVIKILNWNGMNIEYTVEKVKKLRKEWGFNFSLDDYRRLV